MADTSAGQCEAGGARCLDGSDGAGSQGLGFPMDFNGGGDAPGNATTTSPPSFAQGKTTKKTNDAQKKRQATLKELRAELMEEVYKPPGTEAMRSERARLEGAIKYLREHPLFQEFRRAHLATSTHASYTHDAIEN
jgi:hypothetical protein